jgi:hypothetical protein
MATPVYVPVPAAADEGVALKAPLDLSHHFSRVTKARKESSIKEFYKYFMIPGIGQLAGGLPHASFFPYDTLEASVALPERFTPTPNKPNAGTASISEKLESSKISGASTRVLVPHDSAAANPQRKIDLTTGKSSVIYV